MNQVNYFFYSIVFHIILLAILIIGFEFHSKTPVLENSNQNNQMINAVLIESKRIEIPKPVAPKPIIKKIIKKISPPVISKPKAIIIPDKHKKQKQIEKQLMAEIKQQKMLQKKIKQSAIEQEFAKELKSLTQKTKVSKIPSAKMQGIVDKYKALILQAISEQWIVPQNANKNLTTQLLIRLSSDGTVIDVQLVKSSSDDGLDRSARAAVFKASPLPVPDKADEFEPFKEFILKVKPVTAVAAE